MRVIIPFAVFCLCVLFIESCSAYKEYNNERDVGKRKHDSREYSEKYDKKHYKKDYKKDKYQDSNERYDKREKYDKKKEYYKEKYSKGVDDYKRREQRDSGEKYARRNEEFEGKYKSRDYKREKYDRDDSEGSPEEYKKHYKKDFHQDKYDQRDGGADMSDEYKKHKKDWKREKYESEGGDQREYKHYKKDYRKDYRKNDLDPEFIEKKKQEYLKEVTDADFKELNKEYNKEFKSKFVQDYEKDRYTKKTKQRHTSAEKIHMPLNLFESSAENYAMPGVGEFVDTILGSGEEDLRDRDEL